MSDFKHGGQVIVPVLLEFTGDDTLLVVGQYIREAQDLFLKPVQKWRVRIIHFMLVNKNNASKSIVNLTQRVTIRPGATRQFFLLRTTV